jgi:tRNA modification GTPase
MESAELILFIVDGTNADDPLTKKLYNEMLELDKPFVSVINKKDIFADALNVSDCGYKNAILVSALTGDGYDELKDKIGEYCSVSDFGADNEIILNARQNAAVFGAKKSLESARIALESFTQDIACIDIEEAIGCLCELDGKSVSEEIVNEIFSHFCVGK